MLATLHFLATKWPPTFLILESPLNVHDASIICVVLPIVLCFFVQKLDLFNAYEKSLNFGKTAVQI